MNKVVIAGSASQQTAIQQWVAVWREREHDVIAFPEPIPRERLELDYPGVFRSFFAAIEQADISFVANEEKRGIPGYIGSEAFAEIVYALGRKTVHGQPITILLAHEPSPQLPCFDELSLWLKLGHIAVIRPDHAVFSSLR